MDLGEVVGCLEDLITYFAQPEDDLGHEEKQKFLKALRNRQDLFQEEGILNLILDCIDKMNVITSQARKQNNISKLSWTNLHKYVSNTAHVGVAQW